MLPFLPAQVLKLDFTCLRSSCLAVQVAKLLSATDAVSGQLKRRLKVTSSVPTDFFCLVRCSTPQHSTQLSTAHHTSQLMH
jgi:hypothetical protein